MRAFELGARLADALAPRLAGFSRYALVDFPRHSNVGDSAIWLGARATLRAAGLRPAYVCDYWTYRSERLDRATRAGDTVIVINGGGNLGDLYAKHQALREAVLERFPDRPVVQLPQTIHFADRARLEQARRIFDHHRHLTILVRDEASLEIARRWFAAPSALAPDTAFSLAGRIARVGTARQPVVWLLRRDRESALDGAALPPGAVDWRVEDVHGPRVSASDRFVDAVAPVGSRVDGPVLGRAFDLRARMQLRAGLRLLSRGEVVVTDRLHAHILCVLVGVPHVLLNDRNSKVGRFHHTWTTGARGVRTASSLADARAQVETLTAA